MKAGSITFSTELDNAELEKQLNGLTKKIEKKERDIAEITAKRDQAKEKSLFDSAALDEEKSKLEEIKDRLAEIRARAKDKTLSLEDREAAKELIPSVKQEYDEQKTRVQGLQAEWNKTEAAVERYNTQLSAAEKELDRQKSEAGHITEELDKAREAAGGMGGMLDRAGERMDPLLNRMKKLASQVFVFTLITSALRGMRTWLEKTIKTNDEARQSIAQLKGALLTLAQPLVEVIIPAFTALVNILTRIITAAASLVSLLFGKTLKQSKDGAKALYQEASAIDAVGEAAKEAAGSLAGFDEINTIQTENASAGSGGGGISGEGIAPDFEGLIFGELDKITALVSGALLALGAILTFSGANIPLGIALMAAGALGLAQVITENWGAISEALRGPIGAVTALISGALLALGAILLFTGVNIPLGLALIAAGAMGLVAVAVANWDTLSNILKGPIGAVTAAISVALLALGALLAFSGVNLPLGLALMAAGATGLVTSILVNWDTVKQALEGPTGAVTGLISGMLLALGAILLFSGANIPLGLGLLAVGAIGLASSIAANWDTIQQALEGPVGAVTALISSALLALGAILAFSGAATPLGIGLMAVGAVGLATAIAANWNTITDATGGTVQAITAIVSAALLVLGIILLFTGAAAPLGLGLIAAGAIGLAMTIAPNWNFVLDAIKGAWSNVESWWSANAEKFFTLDYWEGIGSDILDGLLGGLKNAWEDIKSWVLDKVEWITSKFSGASRSASGAFGSVPSDGFGVSGISLQSLPSIEPASIPALAQGAVIPPNREFMAVLGDQRNGTNLEAPEDLIRKIVREESGGGAELAEILQVMQSILIAVEAGRVIAVGETVLGRTTIKAINSVNTAAGKQLLLI